MEAVLAQGPIPARILYNTVTGVLSHRGVVRDDLNALPKRFKLLWGAGRRGKPSLNADIQNAAEATRMIADPDMEILGTNADSTCSAFNAEGGVTLTTKTTSGDQVILLPHLDANQSAWTQVTWGTDKETVWECDLSTGAAITTAILWAGLKLTDTGLIATDNDQVFVRYEAGVSGGAWVVAYSIGGTDTTVVTTVLAAVSTRYHIRIAIGATRIAKVYINGALVATTTALTDATDLIPYIGVQTSTAGARAVVVHSEAISRNIG